MIRLAWPIADYLLLTSNTSLTTMHINKLAYISHGWTLAIQDKPLMNEPIEAWRYGPVIPSLYYSFRTYGSNDIDSLGYCQTSLNDKDRIEERKAVITKQFDSKEIEIMNNVLKAHENYSGTQLSEITHKAGSPWDRCYVRDQLHTLIPDEMIKSYYKSLLEVN